MYYINITFKNVLLISLKSKSKRALSNYVLLTAIFFREPRKFLTRLLIFGGWPCIIKLFLFLEILVFSRFTVHK